MCDTKEKTGWKSSDSSESIQNQDQENELQKRRLNFCYLRLCGISVDEIAEQEGISRTAVYKFFQHFPKRASDPPLVFDFDPHYAAEVCMAYLEYRNFSAVAREFSIRRDDVIEIIYRIRDRHHKPSTSCCYSEIYNWMAVCGVDCMKLARKCNVANVTMSNALYGYCHMPFRIASRISQLSGMTLRRVYAPVIPEDVIDRITQASRKNLEEAIQKELENAAQ